MLLLDHLNGTLRHPLHRIRPACATPAVGVQLNLRYAAYAEPLFLHGLPRLPLVFEQVAPVLKCNDRAKTVLRSAFLGGMCSVSDRQHRRKRWT